MFRIRKVFRGGRSSRPTHASAIRVHGRYALRAGTNGRDAAEGARHSATWQAAIAAPSAATNWRQKVVPLIWRHVARARLLC